MKPEGNHGKSGLIPLFLLVKVLDNYMQDFQ